MHKPHKPLLSLPLIKKGKVRDIYAIDDKRILIVTTDRLSAFDVVFDEPINQKGVVLSSVSNFWFNKTTHIVVNHLTHEPLSTIMSAQQANILKGRAVIAKKLKPLAVEAIVRGYLSGSAWKDYQQTQQICGIALPSGLQLATRLPQALYTPSTKAGTGSHDINISFEQTVRILGKSLATQIKKVSLKLYQFAANYALERGIIIADTKFEFGLDEHDRLVLMDEILTPDSSRFWSSSAYRVGVSPENFDKQTIRDYLETIDWDKTPPAPKLPKKIIQKTSSRYLELQELLCN